MNTSSIRIIGGRNKSYRIVFKASPDLRPTSDRAKETLFSWLQFEIENKSCLDLFAGTGGLGLEALSRGANHVTFVEKDKNALQVLKKNLSDIKISNEALLINDSVENYLSRNKDEKYNIFFFDPPFSDKKFKENLKSVRTFKNFLKNHIVIIHRERTAKDDFKDEINILKIKIYGRSKIFFGVF